MRSVFYPHLVNGPFGDPALYVRLAHRGEALLLDCGDLSALSVRELLKVRALFISHAHIDHLVGFDRLLRAFLCSEEPLEIFGPKGITERIGHRLAGYTWNLTESYPLSLTVRAWGDDFFTGARFCARNAFAAEPLPPLANRDGLMWETPACRVRALPLDHGNISSLGFCIEEPLHVAIHKEQLLGRGYEPGPWLTPFKDRLRNGRDGRIEVPLTRGGTLCLGLQELAGQIAHTERGMKLCYVTDASPSPENQEKIVALAHRAHLLAIEATFAHRDLERARLRNHLTARLAGDLARRAQVARLLSFHHSPRYLDHPEELAHEAEAAFGQPPP